MIKKDNSNIFVKYGHNGPSHAHPDKMNIEVLLDGVILSRDLSNSGYGNPLCNEWHRMSPSHNTVVVNGESHTGFGGGKCLESTKTRLKVQAENVYKGVTFTRDVELVETGFSDHFTVKLEEKAVCDYFFHVEGTLISPLDYIDGDIGYSDKGYQHLSNLKKVLVHGDSLSIRWKSGNREITSLINTKDTQVFIGKSPDNSVEGLRNTLILRKETALAEFQIDWEK
jgi:hypothetical protein